MKAVHWTVPFASLKGVQYRVDIYADGECATPIELMGGASPFTTDEDNEEDVNIRTHTGKLEIADCGYTGIEKGKLLSALLPSDNLDRPVRLIEVKSATGESVNRVVWQGFVNCEEYSQEYTSRDQILTLNVNSVLEVLDSVKVSVEDVQAYLSTTSKVLHTKSIMDMVVSKMSEYHTMTYNYSRDLYNLFGRNAYGVNPYRLFEEEKFTDENGKTTTTVSDISLKDMVEPLMQSLGLCLYESGTRLLIKYVGGNQSMTVKTTENVNMADLEWRGTGHTISTRNGARNVIVTASVDEYDPMIEMPDCPIEDLYKKQYYSSEENKVIVKGEFNKIDDAYDTVTLKRYAATLTDSTISNIQVLPLSIATGAVDSYCWLKTADGHSQRAFMNHKKDSSKGYDNYECWASALECFAETGDGSGSNGIYLAGFVLNKYSDFDAEAISFARTNGPILSIKSKKRHLFYNGQLVVKAGAKEVGLKNHKIATGSWQSRAFAEFDEDRLDITLSIRVGDKYYQGNGVWSESLYILHGFINDGHLSYYRAVDSEYNNDRFLAKIDGCLEGDVEVMIWPFMVDEKMDDETQVFEWIMNSLSVEYESDRKFNREREETVYRQSTGLNSGDDKEIEPELISANRTNMGANHLLATNGAQVQKIQYLEGSTNVERRPEKDLLARMVTQYGKVRRVIELETAITDRAIPEWILYDQPNNKYYTPFAESKDWRMDNSTVRLIER